jgi:hypothetical protein
MKKGEAKAPSFFAFEKLNKYPIITDFWASWRLLWLEHRFLQVILFFRLKPFHQKIKGAREDALN